MLLGHLTSYLFSRNQALSSYIFEAYNFLLMCSLENW